MNTTPLMKPTLMPKYTYQVSTSIWMIIVIQSPPGFIMIAGTDPSHQGSGTLCRYIVAKPYKKTDSCDID